MRGILVVPWASNPVKQVRLLSPAPYRSVLWMRTLRYERGQVGSIPSRSTKLLAWRSGCAPECQSGDAGSIPAARTKFDDIERGLPSE